MNNYWGYLLIIVCLLFNSCGIGIPMEKMRPIPPSESLPQPQRIVKDSIDELVFDMSIKFINSYNSGILAYANEREKSGTYRTVFMAKAGVKLFDFEFSENNMIVNSIIPQLDRSIILNLLERDLRMIFDPIVNLQGTYQTMDSGSILSRGKLNDDLYHYYLKQSGLIYRIDKGSEHKSVVRLDVRYDSENIPERIFIQHKKIPFLMRLNRLASVN